MEKQLKCTTNSKVDHRTTIHLFNFYYLYFPPVFHLLIFICFRQGLTIYPRLLRIHDPPVSASQLLELQAYILVPIIYISKTKTKQQKRQCKNRGNDRENKRLLLLLRSWSRVSPSTLQLELNKFFQLN